MAQPGNGCGREHHRAVSQRFRVERQPIMALSSLLVILLDQTRSKTLRSLQDVTEDEARWAPPNLQNTILWHAGHSYILSERLVLEPLGRTPQIPEGWFALFGWGSRPAEFPDGHWPTLALVIDRLNSQHTRVHKAILEASDDQLARPVPPNPEQTVASVVTHGLHDEACHCGEILLLRKLQRARPAD